MSSMVFCNTVQMIVFSLMIVQRDAVFISLHGHLIVHLIKRQKLDHMLYFYKEAYKIFFLNAGREFSEVLC